MEQTNILTYETPFYTFLTLDNDDFLASYTSRNSFYFQTILSEYICQINTYPNSENLINFIKNHFKHYTNCKEHLINMNLALYSYLYENTSLFKDGYVQLLVDRIYDEMTFHHVFKTKFLFEGRFVLNIDSKTYNRIKISNEQIHYLLYNLFQYNKITE
ncbi:hypothetical protein PBI_SCTP2_25 [Salicola phage SCTP-2]|nr:hypothetical protein PBI_SCTP2_25 [Salicola phage SCTP-2]